MLIKPLFVKGKFETLAHEFLKPEMKNKLPKVVKDAPKHGRMHEHTARQN